MQKLRLVPLGSESVEERVAAFRQYSDEVSAINACFFTVIRQVPFFENPRGFPILFLQD